MVEFYEQKIILPAYGLHFYINIRTFSVFRDCNYIKSIRLLGGFFFKELIYSFLIDTKSRKVRLNLKRNFSLCIYSLTKFLNKFGVHVHLGELLWF